MRHILLIGMGAVGRHVARALQNEANRVRLSILVRSQYVKEVKTRVDEVVPGEVQVVDRYEKLTDMPELAVECAGHAAVAEFGEECLTSGADFLVTSVGALTDTLVLQRLERASRTHMGKLMIPAGAIAGIDALAAARYGGLERVRYTSRKAPEAWKGTPAEQMCNLGALHGPTPFYTGNAGEAARLFPQNANVAATIALAGLGFDRTEVSLSADPDAPGNVHVIEAEGAFGELRVEVQGRPLADNPKTSTLAALSVLRAIHNRIDAIQI
jgi:aspartate dehydrogenase